MKNRLINSIKRRLKRFLDIEDVPVLDEEPEFDFVTEYKPDWGEVEDEFLAALSSLNGIAYNDISDVIETLYPKNGSKQAKNDARGYVFSYGVLITIRDLRNIKEHENNNPLKDDAVECGIILMEGVINNI